jgi:hypothetical protein
MKIHKLTWLFHNRYRDRNGAPLLAKWIKSRGETLLINPNAGTVIANLRDDGEGGFEAVIYASLWQAISLATVRCCFLVSVRPFPRVTLELTYLPGENLHEAKQSLAVILGVQTA